MPKVARELGPLDVRRLAHPGSTGNLMVPVGGVAGLYLQLTPKGGRSWILRMLVGGRRRDIGLGGFPTVTLAHAREKAREARDKVERGVDPVEERKAAKVKLIEARRKGMLFSEAVDKALAAKLYAFRNEKHRAQWRSTLDNYALPEIGTLPVAKIDTAAVLRCLQPIWATKTETASRLRGRIEAVLSWATVAGHRSGDNPARWAGNLKELLPAASKVAKESNHPALQLDDAPVWLADLRKRDGFPARALEFLALTAARSGEIRGATWEEIDFDKTIWIIPAQRMKMQREHRVPLTGEAVALLKALPKLDDNSLVFPGAKGSQLSDMALSKLMKRQHLAGIAAGGPGYVDRVSKRPAVPHGMRSTFRDWVAERTQYPGDMAEVALAHRISSAVEAAYRRGDMIEKRRRMMADWAVFLSSPAPSHNQLNRVGCSLMTTRYLPLLRSNGDWIDRPDLFLLARMSYEDSQDDRIVNQLYEIMVSADNSSPEINILEEVVVKSQIQRNQRHRVFAGSVVLELIRLAATTEKKPLLKQAVRLVAFNQGRREAGKAQPESLWREIEKGISAYRNTAHLQAAMVLADPGEASVTDVLAFLARARGFEHFLCTAVVGKDFRWEPWCVPDVVPPTFDTTIRRLSAEEISAAGGLKN